MSARPTGFRRGRSRREASARSTAATADTPHAVRIERHSVRRSSHHRSRLALRRPWQCAAARRRRPRVVDGAEHRVELAPWVRDSLEAHQNASPLRKGFFGGLRPRPPPAVERSRADHRQPRGRASLACSWSGPAAVRSATQAPRFLISGSELRMTTALASPTHTTGGHRPGGCHHCKILSPVVQLPRESTTSAARRFRRRVSSRALSYLAALRRS